MYFITVSFFSSTPVYLKRNESGDSDEMLTPLIRIAGRKSRVSAVCCVYNRHAQYTVVNIPIIQITSFLFTDRLENECKYIFISTYEQNSGLLLNKITVQFRISLSLCSDSVFILLLVISMYIHVIPI